MLKYEQLINRYEKIVIILHTIILLSTPSPSHLNVSLDYPPSPPAFDMSCYKYKYQLKTQFT